MLFEYCNGLVLTALLLGLCTRFDAEAEGVEKFRVEGRALVYGVGTEEWTPRARVLLDAEEHVGFVRFLKIVFKKARYSAMHRLPGRML